MLYVVSYLLYVLCMSWAGRRIYYGPEGDYIMGRKALCYGPEGDMMCDGPEGRRG